MKKTLKIMLLGTTLMVASHSFGAQVEDPEERVKATGRVRNIASQFPKVLAEDDTMLRQHHRVIKQVIDENTTLSNEAIIAILRKSDGRDEEEATEGEGGTTGQAATEDEKEGSQPPAAPKKEGGTEEEATEGEGGTTGQGGGEAPAAAAPKKEGDTEEDVAEDAGKGEAPKAAAAPADPLAGATPTELASMQQIAGDIGINLRSKPGVLDAYRRIEAAGGKRAQKRLAFAAFLRDQ